MPSKYKSIISKVFFDNFSKGMTSVKFSRQELADACKHLEIERIKNLGDIPYSFRFRRELPDAVLKSAPMGHEWIIVGRGVGSYEFRLSKIGKIEPAQHRQRIKIPDATPEILKKYAPANDEQALLTKVRYNRIIDIFTSLTCYSIQNHLRTTVNGIGQIEVDEIYLGISKGGGHFVIPCQAKSPGDKFGIVQVMQDIELCSQKYSTLVCRPIAMQFLDSDSFAILELAVSDDNSILRLEVIDEKHYQLVRNEDLTKDEVVMYSKVDK